MRKKARLLFLVSLLTLSSCGPKDLPQREGHPALRLTLSAAGGEYVDLQLELLNAESARVLVRMGTEPDPDVGEILGTGRAFSAGAARVEGLSARTDYIAYGVAVRGEETGSVQSVAFTTHAGTEELYDWERRREGIPSYADLVLLYGSWRRDARTKAVLEWTQERIAPLVSHVGEDGREHWLFDAFLALEGFSGLRREEGRTFGLGTLEYEGGPARRAATREDALYFLDWWFRPGNGFDALDRAVGAAAARMGTPPSPRCVVVMLPDISVHERYNDLSSSTAYWAPAYDFRSAEARVAAYCSYVDEVRLRFAEASFRNIELGGFYIMTEELPSEREGEGSRWGERGKDGWEQAFKQWEDVYPAVSSYIRQFRESVTWIPYYRAAGYRYWKEFGIDHAFMQPNRYWDDAGTKPIQDFFRRLSSDRDLGMELEFDDLMIAGYHDEATVAEHRRRWREYVDGFREAGIYGSRPFAVYQDTDSFNHLRISEDPADRAAYEELCTLIARNPLKVQPAS